MTRTVLLPKDATDHPEAGGLRIKTPPCYGVAVSACRLFHFFPNSNLHLNLFEKGGRPEELNFNTGYRLSLYASLSMFRLPVVSRSLYPAAIARGGAAAATASHNGK